MEKVYNLGARGHLTLIESLLSCCHMLVLGTLLCDFLAVLTKLLPFYEYEWCLHISGKHTCLKKS